jgi:hypothetical protein
VAGYEAQLLCRQFPFDNMEIGAADATSAYPQQHVPRPQAWVCNLNNAQRTFGNSVRTRQKSGFHGGFLPRV